MTAVAERRDAGPGCLQARRAQANMPKLMSPSTWRDPDLIWSMIHDLMTDPGFPDLASGQPVCDFRPTNRTHFRFPKVTFHFWPVISFIFILPRESCQVSFIFPKLSFVWSSDFPYASAVCLFCLDFHCLISLFLLSKSFWQKSFSIKSSSELDLCHSRAYQNTDS